jgi:predicted DNA-binding transcriptional regulator YafY
MSESSSANAARRAELAKIRQMLSKAFNSDLYAVRITYTDAAGVVANRTISPIRFIKEGRDHVLALCTGREEPRQFALMRISHCELVKASDVQMPEPITEGVES